MEAHDIKGVILGNFKTLYYVNRPYGDLCDLENDPLNQRIYGTISNINKKSYRV